MVAAGARPADCESTECRLERRRSVCSPAELVRDLPRLDPRRAARPRGHISGDSAAIASEMPWYAKSVHRPPRLAREGRGEAPRQVVRLGAGIDEEDRIEPGRAGRDQALGELDGALVQVAQVRVQPARLAGDRLGRRADGRGRRTGRCCRHRGSAGRRRRSSRRPGRWPSGSAARRSVVRGRAQGRRSRRSMRCARPRRCRRHVGAEPSRDLVPADVEQGLDRPRDGVVVALGEGRVLEARGPSATTRS